MSSSSFFESVDAIRFAGPDSDDPLAFRWYDADRVVLAEVDGGASAVRGVLLAQLRVGWFGHLRVGDVGSSVEPVVAYR